uniref:Uncharacterized protein n=1 Tax=Ascaris lumbricoides TaxID=6252 RepID=A0A0M3IXS8_ASCLU
MMPSYDVASVTADRQTDRRTEKYLNTKMRFLSPLGNKFIRTCANKSFIDLCERSVRLNSSILRIFYYLLAIQDKRYSGLRNAYANIIALRLFIPGLICKITH